MTTTMMMMSDGDDDDDDNTSLGEEEDDRGDRAACFYSNVDGDRDAMDLIGIHRGFDPPDRFIGSESSSSGDEERRRRAATMTVISGKGRPVEQEMTLLKRRRSAMQKLEQHEQMAEMEQEHDIDDDGGDDDDEAVIDEEELRREWEKVQQERRKPALDKMERDQKEMERTAWTLKADKRKKQKKKKKRRRRQSSKDSAAATKKKGKRRDKKRKKADTVVDMTEDERRKAAKALEAAAAEGFEEFALTRTEPSKMRSKRSSSSSKNSKNTVIDESTPSQIRYLGDMLRACIVTYLWGANSSQKPDKDDMPIIGTVLPNANLFMESGKELGRSVAQSCVELFRLRDNSAMEVVLEVLQDIAEVHLQPTVRKKPAEATVNVWTGQVLGSKDLHRMSSVVFNPVKKTSSPNSVIVSKQPATMLSLVHFLAHFDLYCKRVIHQALVDHKSELSPKMRWKKAWEVCVGSSMANKNVLQWVRSGNSVTSFTSAGVKLRELIHTCLWLDDFLKQAVIDTQKADAAVQSKT